MIKTNDQMMTEALSEALETMAFMMVMPIEDPLPSPAEAVCVTMDFTGPTSGQLQLAAPTGFLDVMTGNIIGCDHDDPQIAGRGVDALKELLNTVGGVLLPKLATSLADVFQVTIPQAVEWTSEKQWDEFVSHPDVAVFDVDCDPVALRMSMAG